MRSVTFPLSRLMAPVARKRITRIAQWLKQLRHCCVGTLSVGASYLHTFNRGQFEADFALYDAFSRQFYVKHMVISGGSIEMYGPNYEVLLYFVINADWLSAGVGNGKKVSSWPKEHIKVWMEGTC